VRWPAERLSPTTVAVAVAAIGVVLGAVGLAPVRSQTPALDAPQAPAPIADDEPWAAVWESAPALRVPLSAQNIAPPFGGGAVNSVTARAFHDAGRLYVVLEWADGGQDASVAATEDFSDAAALQFPIGSGAATPYTMGGPGLPVNIWQWKAVWQADIESGFETTADRWPDTLVDLYPHPDDPLYRPAEGLGNLQADRDRSTPIEDLVAEGFGTLTTADAQNVTGSGEWRDGRWRALFARDLDPGSTEATTFAVGATTPVAFAVWDGNAGDRNGEKSIAQFVDLRLVGDVTLPTVPEVVEPDGSTTLPIFLVGIGGLLLLSLLLLSFGRKQKSED